MAISQIRGRTAGGFALSRLGKAQKQIAIEVGVSNVSVHQWTTGAKRPGPVLRGKLFELYGIPVTAWDEEVARSPRPTPAPAAPPAPPRAVDLEVAGGAFAMARALQRQAETQLNELESPEVAWTPAEKAQVTLRLASTVNVLAKLTGQYELGRRIMQLPIWKQLETEMFEALRAFPDAAKAVAERLERFESVWVGKAD